jgi:chromosome segregation ATPase
MEPVKQKPVSSTGVQLMLSFCTKQVVRWGLITAVVVGGTTVLIGPERVAAGFDQVRSLAAATFDDFVDDPVALRRQLKGLADQYPDRIAEVRGELSEIEVQMGQLDHDTDVATRVVTLTDTDLDLLKERIVEATSGSPSGQKVLIRRGSFDVGLDQARSEGRRIAGIRSAYQDRIIGNDQQVMLLGRQKQRLTDILAQLESEYGEFEAKLWQLDRQIDSIERNDRLIAMTEEQQAMLRDFEKLGKVGNLRQLEAKLEELRTTQEAQLQTLERHGIQGEYEQRARDTITIDGAHRSSLLTDPDLAWLN